jgi:hypothetical protein
MKQLERVPLHNARDYIILQLISVHRYELVAPLYKDHILTQLMSPLIPPFIADLAASNCP